jgi:hypothetical protein
MALTRTLQLGKREELRKAIRQLEYSIDSKVQTLQDQFQLKTRDLSYIKDIDPERVKTYGSDIAADVKRLKKLLADLEDLNHEIGEED